MAKVPVAKFSALTRTLAGSSLVALVGAGGAHAAALEQVVPSTIRLLYEPGMYAEVGIGYTDPHQSGDGLAIPPNGAGIPSGFYSGNTGDVFDSRWNYSGAFKGDINERLSYAITFDQPLQADTTYGGALFTNAPTGFSYPFYQGSFADLKTYQIMAALAYDVTDNVKVFGGLRAQRLDAKAGISFVDGYRIDAEKKWSYGYMLGAAYERPDIALRVALSYYSKISYDLSTSESIDSLPVPIRDTTEVETPQSVQLDFQTGVAPKTLVFGYVRWVDWSEFSIAPQLYGQAIEGLIGVPRPLVDYADDWWTYNLGVGRQLTETLAGSLSITWEPSVGGEMTSLGPYDGRTTATAALSYDYGQWNFTGGLSYGVLGDTHNLLQTDFDDGSVWGAGLRVGYSF